jgi:hypothetical protein
MTIELDKTEYEVGDVAIASIVVSDIEQEFGFQKLISTFDFDLMFDSTLMSYQSSVFGEKLDVDPLFASDQFVDSSSLVNSVYLSEISYALSFDLFFAQDGLTEFTLASVNFDVLASGTTNLLLGNVLLSDDFGDSFSQVTTLPTAFNSTSVGVPEPSTLLLLGLSVIAFINRKFFQ